MDRKNNTNYFITIKKQFLKDYFLNMSDNKLLEYIRYSLKTGIRCRLEYLNKNKKLSDNDVIRYYSKLVKNRCVKIDNDSLIYGINIDDKQDILNKEIFDYVIINTIKSIAKRILKESIIKNTTLSLNDKKIDIGDIEPMSIPRYPKLYGIVKEVYVEFDNSTEVSSQYYKTPIREIFIEAVNKDKNILVSRLKDIIDNHLSFLILDTGKWIESTIKRPLINLTYDLEVKDDTYIIKYNTQSYVKGAITLAVREIDIKAD